MRLKVIRDKSHPKTPWAVVLPARLSPDGKRKWRRFSTRTAASDFSASVSAWVKDNGEHAIAVVPASTAADMQSATQLLVGTGLSLTDLARLYLHHRGDMAHAPYSGAWGRGGEATASANILPGSAPARATFREVTAMMQSIKQHQSPATIAARKTIFSSLWRDSPHLADMPLQNITTRDINAAMERTFGRSPSSWNNAYRHITVLFNFAIRKELYHGRNPLALIDVKHVAETEIRALPPNDLRSLLAACRPPTPSERAAGDIYDLSDLRLYFCICAFAGIRPTECSKILWQDIDDTDDMVISVRQRAAKTGGIRHIQLLPTLAAWLRALRPANVAGTDLITPAPNLRKRVAAARSRAGFGSKKEWQSDCLRHSFATYYLKANCGDIHRLQLNMGHRDFQLLYNRYTNMAGVTRAIADEWWQILPE